MNDNSKTNVTLKYLVVTMYGVNCLTCNSTLCLTCQPGFVMNSTFQCAAVVCSTQCQLCSLVSTNCTSCYAAQNRYLISNICVPLSGYYESGTDISPLCVSPCITCSSLTICSTCVVGYFLNSSNNCQSCIKYHPQCVACDNVTCLQCSSSYISS
jgi:hypothetical protein